MWADIGDEVWGAGQETQARRADMELAIRGARRNAHRRAINGFVQATGTEYRYQNDPLYHTAVDTIALAMTAAIFEETMLSLRERHERVTQLMKVAEGITMSPGDYWTPEYVERLIEEEGPKS